MNGINKYAALGVFGASVHGDAPNPTEHNSEQHLL